jgi:hypothetical protein
MCGDRFVVSSVNTSKHRQWTQRAGCSRWATEGVSSLKNEDGGFRLKYTMDHNSQSMEATKTHRMDRGRCQDRGRYHPIAGGVNTTNKLNTKRHPAVSGGGSAGIVASSVSPTERRTFFCRAC